MENQHDRKTWTLADAVRAVDNPKSTPADIRAALSWNCITPYAAVAWLRGWNAGLRSNGAEPALIGRVA